MENITYPAALLGGILSFFSPCILPLIPAYFSFITGLSLEELTQDNPKIRSKVVLSTLAYVAGISSTFIVLGGSASLLGNLISEFEWILRYVGGTIVIIFGLHLLGIININAMNFDKKLHVQKKPVHLAGIFLIGMAFGVGWSPCIGPILRAILVMAAKEGSLLKGSLLLTVYSAGFSIPFLIMAVFIPSVLTTVKAMTRYMGLLNKIAGSLLIFIGLLLILNRFRFLAAI